MITQDEVKQIAEALTVAEGQVLLEVRDSQGWTVKSLGEIAEDTCMSINTVRRTIKSLREKNLVELIRLTQDEYDHTLCGSGYARTYAGDRVATEISQS
ncbi:hypothetical protein [Burkholderia phage vB_BpP_HN03]|uniref:Uncharacterized protein n=1 Tax=Burkholderia phage vB_BpP_HN02 TaxID=3116925 RepID=A0AAX4JIU5_9CAUD|nr:hypothetical protein [Burkholderia phage vB_BpP_HN01]